MQIETTPIQVSRQYRQLEFFLFQVLLKEAHHVLSVSHTPRKKSARVCVICEHRVLILKEPYPHASTTRLSDFYRVEFPKDKRET